MDLTGNSGSYTGTLKNGLRHGVGRMIYHDGKIWEGQFKNGVWHGYRRSYLKDGFNIVQYYENAW